MNLEPCGVNWPDNPKIAGWSCCQTSRPRTDQGPASAHTASHGVEELEASRKRWQPRSRRTRSPTPGRESSVTHDGERIGWKPLVSSHSWSSSLEYFRPQRGQLDWWCRINPHRVMPTQVQENNYRVVRKRSSPIIWLGQVPRQIIHDYQALSGLAYWHTNRTKANHFFSIWLSLQGLIMKWKTTMKTATMYVYDDHKSQFAKETSHSEHVEKNESN